MLQFAPLFPLVLSFAAPSPASAPAKGAAPAPEPTAAPATDAYDRAAANADVDTILSDTSKAYLRSRGRLVAHPGPAADALIERLEATPPPTGGERKRILDVLAEIGGADHVQRFADELRRAATQAEGDGRAMAAAEVWRPLLRDQGAHAMAALIGLVADKELPLGVREAMLEDLVAITPSDRVAELLALVGRGHTSLRQQFVRSLRRRLARDEALRTVLTTVIDAEIPNAADARRLAGLVLLRAAIHDEVDTAFVATLVGLAQDAKRPFPVRVAAVRALSASATDASAQAGLESVATEALAKPSAGTQAGEILAWLALSALPADRAAALATKHDLVHADAPRLTERAWTVVPLAKSGGWLDDALADPWPQVRKAAIGRVQGPCDRTVLGKLRARVGEKAGDRDPAVQRAAVDAIGRCGGDRAFALLSGMLDDADVHNEQSAEAARQLARGYGARGADAVAKRLERKPEAAWGRRLAQALRHATDPTPRVREALCDAAEQGGEVGRAAAQSLFALWPQESDHCIEEE